MVLLVVIEWPSSLQPSSTDLFLEREGDTCKYTQMLQLVSIVDLGGDLR